MYKCFLCCKPTDEVYECWNSGHTAMMLICESCKNSLMFICESCKDSLKKEKNNDREKN